MVPSIGDEILGHPEGTKHHSKLRRKQKGVGAGGRELETVGPGKVTAWYIGQELQSPDIRVTTFVLCQGGHGEITTLLASEPRHAWNPL